MFKLLQIIILLGCCSITYADSLDILFGGWSHHYNATLPDLNESHNLIAIDVGKINFGTYINSYNDRSNFISYEWDWVKWDYVEVFCNLTTVSGYSKESGMYPIMPIPTITLGNHALRIDISTIPTKVTMVNFRLKIK